MGTAFNTALSALNADATAIDVVGNNLANLNTTGFKDSKAEFLGPHGPTDRLRQ